MKNVLKNVFDDDILIDAIEGMVVIFKKANMSSERIAEEIKGFDEIVRESFHISALSNGDKELADRIYGAITILKNRRISEFKEAVDKGEEKEFLSSMTLAEKSLLMFDMGLTISSILTEEQQRYYDIIEKSIAEDIKRQALIEGFNSVEEWKEHNSRIYSSDDSDFTM